MTAAADALREHLQRPVTSVCQCWIITRRDGARQGFTDHDREIAVDGVPCRPQTGFTASEARSSLGLAVDVAEIDGALSSPTLDPEAIERGDYDGAEVVTWLVNWRDAQACRPIRRATIGRMVRADGRFVAELNGLGRALERPAGRLVRRTCDAELGDGRCGVGLDDEDFRAPVAVSGIDAATVRASGAGGFPQGWFEAGTVEWTTGARAGRVDRVLTDVRAGTERQLRFEAEPDGVSAGDAAILTTGCDKRFATCGAKFANTMNFRGFPHLPGNDAAYGHARDGDLFDGGPLVP
jgi:uncharacterized phage protein (TIGR02218 family)